MNRGAEKGKKGTVPFFPFSKRKEQKMKIVFMGTPDFAKESLKAIYESKNKYEILGVVTKAEE